MKKGKLKKWHYGLFALMIPLLGIFIWQPSREEVEINHHDKTRNEQWMADLNFFENVYLSDSKTFSKDTAESCKVLLDSLRKNIDRLSDNQMTLELSKAVAMANNGHTTIHLSGMDKIPLRFYWFKDGLYIIKTDKASSKYLGSKVLKINSMDINNVFQKMKPHLSGIDRFKKFTASNYLSSPQILNGLGISKADTLELSLLRDSDTLKVNFGIKKMPDTKYEYETWADLYPNNKQDTSWNHLLNADDQLPLYLKDMEKGVSHTFMDSEKIAYFGINALWYKCNDFEGQIDAFLDTLKTKSDYNVIIDLRYYTGGNFMKPTKLATHTPEIIDEGKKIYLVTSNKTFSAGLVTAARVKYFAEDKVVIVGEEVGDNLKFWAEGDYYTLPYSQIKIQDSKYEHDWAEDTFTLGKTFWVNAFYGVPAKNLDVDKNISMSFQDYATHRDPIVEWVLKHKQ
ncbi:S41 family peptidase [Costertonia aggregata]|uniref:Peptidase S41 n=1 Tax=Costertonia aggregata TaxID=343403 RepID=A0A7H9APV8_9FLAO|nr:hypothetical protein [Costertonia aggregata]QLG45470.1 hypothetical protein HYG79_08975 [Costertonia aggregata]